MKKIDIKTMKISISILTITVIVGLFSAFFLYGNGVPEVVFETVEVKRGSISNTVTATGTLEATNTVIVGTQVSGVIEKIHVDFNSIVAKGQLIAEIDKSTLQSSLQNAEADLDMAQAELAYYQASFKRQKVIYDKGLLSDSDYDLAKFNYKKSQAVFKSAKANLDKAKRYLSYAMIYSPLDGIVLNRAFEEGQTIASSLTTPELFTIANDLSEMKVEVDIDEADIGMVKQGQRVEFTVDAFPLKNFSGKVTEVRLQPTETSNVITYTVIVSAGNPDLKLKPGMTASVTVYVDEKRDVLVLAETALSFELEKPDDKGVAIRPKMNNAALPENMKRIWIKKDAGIRPLMIETGARDGIYIQIVKGLREGDRVITAMKKLENTRPGKETQSSPFVQKRPGGGKR